MVARFNPVPCKRSASHPPPPTTHCQDGRPLQRWRVCRNRTANKHTLSMDFWAAEARQTEFHDPRPGHRKAPKRNRFMPSGRGPGPTTLWPFSGGGPFPGNRRGRKFAENGAAEEMDGATSRRCRCPSGGGGPLHVGGDGKPLRPDGAAGRPPQKPKMDASTIGRNFAILCRNLGSESTSHPRPAVICDFAVCPSFCGQC